MCSFLEIKLINFWFALNGHGVQLTATLFITLHSFEDFYYVQTSFNENNFFFLPFRRGTYILAVRYPKSGIFILVT